MGYNQYAFFLLGHYASWLEVNFDWLKFGEGNPLTVAHSKRKEKLNENLKQRDILQNLVEQRYSVLSIDENLLELIIEAICEYSNSRTKKLTPKQIGAASAQLYNHLRKVENDSTLRAKIINFSVETYFNLAKKNDKKK